MAEVRAVHTILRPSKRKGEQEKILPGTKFEVSGEELERLKARGAVKVLGERSSAKAASGTKAAPKPEAKAESGGSLNDL